MKINKKLYPILILTVLFGNVLAFMEDWLPPSLDYPPIISAPIQIFFHSIFLLLYFFWINTTFRYDNRATVYKKNIKYVVSYIAIFAVLLSISIALEFLYYNYMLYLACLIGAVLCAVIGIEAAMLFNKKHPPKFFAEENKLAKFLFCALVVVSVLFNFDSISKLGYFFVTAERNTYSFCVHCILMIVFFELAQKLYTNGNQKVALTCFPLILTAYITSALSGWICVIVTHLPFVLNRLSLSYIILYLQSSIFSYTTVIAYAFLGIWLAHSMQKKENGIEEATLEEQERSDA